MKIDRLLEIIIILINKETADRFGIFKVNDDSHISITYMARIIMAQFTMVIKGDIGEVISEMIHEKYIEKLYII